MDKTTVSVTKVIKVVAWVFRQFFQLKATGINSQEKSQYLNCLGSILSELCKKTVDGVKKITIVSNTLILTGGVFKHSAFVLQIFTDSLKKIWIKGKKEGILTLS